MPSGMNCFPVGPMILLPTTVYWFEIGTVSGGGLLCRNQRKPATNRITTRTTMTTLRPLNRPFVTHEEASLLATSLMTTRPTARVFVTRLGRARYVSAADDETDESGGGLPLGDPLARCAHSGRHSSRGVHNSGRGPTASSTLRPSQGPTLIFARQPEDNDVPDSPDSPRADALQPSVPPAVSVVAADVQDTGTRVILLPLSLSAPPS